jgi:hypothetical protein
VVAVYQGSTGIPRTINVICDNALIGGFAAQLKPVPGSVVEEVCRDFDLSPQATAAAAEAVGPGVEPQVSTLRPLPRRALPAAATASGDDREMFSSSAEPPKRRFSFFS